MSQRIDPRPGDRRLLAAPATRRGEPRVGMPLAGQQRRRGEQDLVVLRPRAQRVGPAVGELVGTVLERDEAVLGTLAQILRHARIIAELEQQPQHAVQHEVRAVEPRIHVGERGVEDPDVRGAAGGQPRDFVEHRGQMGGRRACAHVRQEGLPPRIGVAADGDLGMRIVRATARDARRRRADRRQLVGHERMAERVRGHLHPSSRQTKRVPSADLRAKRTGPSTTSPPRSSVTGSAATS